MEKSELERRVTPEDPRFPAAIDGLVRDGMIELEGGQVGLP
jgi:hypothetical protein